VQHLKNILVGFLVSFMGSIPLGYLNIIGYQLYQKSGLQPTIHYLLGVISIEFLVIYFTLLFAKILAEQKKLTQYIEGFSVLFMFLLAAVFYFGAHSKTDYATTFHYAPYILGVVLSCLNFIQIPFWTGWNLYLLNGNYIEISNARKYGYVLGTVLGTFSGMLALIFSLHYFTSNSNFLTNYLMKLIIPMVFFVLGIYQAIMFYRKYFHNIN